MYYIGIDLGGTNIAAGIVDENGKIIKKDSVPTKHERGAEAVCLDMAKLAEKLIADSGIDRAQFKAIGVGIPGLANFETGFVYKCANLYWENVEMSKIMHTVTDLPIYLENDATVAGLAESVAGISKGYDNSIFLTLGTGVGGGIVIGGKIYTGNNHIRSEIGHMTFDVHGEECPCGNRGCWERYASATALINMGKKAVEEDPESLILKKAGSVDNITARDVIDSAREGDKTAYKVYDQYIYYLAMGIVSLIHLFDPEIIAIGGGVSGAGEFLLEPLRKEVYKHVFCADIGYAKIELATLGNDAGIIGAAMLGK